MVRTKRKLIKHYYRGYSLSGAERTKLLYMKPKNRIKDSIKRDPTVGLKDRRFLYKRLNANFKTQKRQ